MWQPCELPYTCYLLTYYKFLIRYDMYRLSSSGQIKGETRTVTQSYGTPGPRSCSDWTPPLPPPPPAASLVVGARSLLDGARRSAAAATDLISSTVVVLLCRSGPQRSATGRRLASVVRARTRHAPNSPRARAGLGVRDKKTRRGANRWSLCNAECSTVV